MSMSQLNEIWNEYDVDGNGILDRNELRQLASDCINRTLKMFRDELKKVNPKLSESELEKLVEKERYFLLPGKKKKIHIKKWLKC